MTRRAGILLHPTSLPGPYGSGDIGPVARAYLSWLDSAGQSIWQFLPLNPVDGMGSPYSSPSAFAGNPMLLSVDDLVEDGWLREVEKPFFGGAERRFEYSKVAVARMPALEIAADRCAEQVDFEAFGREHEWLADWVLFAVLADEHGGDWTTWPEALRSRDPAALSQVRERSGKAIAQKAALQWLFWQQWQRLRGEAESRGIQLWGDLPFLVSLGSADVWANQHLFRLDENCRPQVVSGVPPDAFTPEGQMWGHPHYALDAHRAEGWRWWCARLEGLLKLVHSVRLDHFRGVESVWEVRADAPNAIEGHWAPGPGHQMLAAMDKHLGGLPIIAEDLGIITPEVEKLRDDFGLPGMAILEFAFGGEPHHPYLPHKHRNNQVVYPGTHDNDTAVGWYHTSDEGTRDRVRRYLTCDGGDIAWDLLRASYRSVADTAILQMQDVLSLDGSARMNVPGQAMGNWGWRMGREAMNLTLAQRLRAEVEITGRMPNSEAS